MKQLSGTDNLFLQMEHGNQHLHVAGLGIYDPSTAPGGKVRFKDVLHFFESRLDASPVFRRRLVNVRVTGGSSASRWHASIRGRSISASRCGRRTSSSN
jgi:diacylglycerol O-acyltransferase